MLQCIWMFFYALSQLFSAFSVLRDAFQCFLNILNAFQYLFVLVLCVSMVSMFKIVRFYRNCWPECQASCTEWRPPRWSGCPGHGNTQRAALWPCSCVSALLTATVRMCQQAWHASSSQEPEIVFLDNLGKLFEKWSNGWIIRVTVCWFELMLIAALGCSSPLFWIVRGGPNVPGPLAHFHVDNRIKI